MSKSRFEAFVSPIGTAVFPYLIQPDTRHDANGVYHVDVSIPADLAEEFVSRLDKALDTYIETELNSTQKTTLARKPVYRPEFTFPQYPDGASEEERAAIKDAHIPEETGNLLFRTKMAAQFTTKKGETVTQKPVVVSADTGERVTEVVYMGSTLRVKGQIIPYINAAAQIVGLSLRLKSAQIIELKTGSGEGFWTDFESDDSE
jgi:hypothetical protein